MRGRKIYRTLAPALRFKEADGDNTDADDTKTTGSDEADDSDGGTGGGGKDKRFTQEELNAIVQDRLNKEKDKAKKAEEAAQQKAKADALKEQEKFKELADTETERADKAEGLVAELSTEKQTLGEQVERYKEALAKYAEAAKDGLDEAVLELLAERDPVDQLEWLANNAEKLRKTTNNTQGVPPTPRGNGSGNNEEANRRAREGFARNYRSF